MLHRTMQLLNLGLHWLDRHRSRTTTFVSPARMLRDPTHPQPSRLALCVDTKGTRQSLFQARVMSACRHDTPILRDPCDGRGNGRVCGSLLCIRQPTTAPPHPEIHVHSIPTRLPPLGACRLLPCPCRHTTQHLVHPDGLWVALCQRREFGGLRAAPCPLQAHAQNIMCPER